MSSDLEVSEMNLPVSPFIIITSDLAVSFSHAPERVSLLGHARAHCSRPEAVSYRRAGERATATWIRGVHLSNMTVEVERTDVLSAGPLFVLRDLIVRFERFGVMSALE